jgi:methionine-rich copper-binding protein CopC
MATSHVIGALALYASQNLSATSAQLRSQLLSNTTTLAALVGKTVTGGTLDVSKIMSGGTPPTDITAPLLSSATPADENTNVAVGANLVMTFNENVQSGSGNIQIYNSNGTIARRISIADASQVTFSGNTVTINPRADLARGAGYYVNMSSGVIRDTAGNSFAGISNAAAWNFMTLAPQDYAGNTLATTWNIGVLTGSRVFSDFVGSSDINDYYRFTLNSRSNFVLSLTGMSADADVHILNASGSLIASSAAANANNESISEALDAGNYYVRVYQYSGDTNYTLGLAQQNVAALSSGVARYGADHPDDVTTGTGFADLLSGAQITEALMGSGSIDRLTGGGLGNDLFILGDARGRFYDEQNLGNSDMGDYSIISDFQVSGDRIQVPSDYYSLATTTLNGAGVMGIYGDSNSNRSFGSNDELVGFQQGVSVSTLPSANFSLG